MLAQGKFDEAEEALRQSAQIELMSPGIRARHMLYLAAVASARAEAADKLGDESAGRFYTTALTLYERLRAIHPQTSIQVS